ncbi:thermonuclease family protein [Listeria monocytogenes]|nr:thermonuclease family protein [Listeria monocytogenes]EDP7792454.1 thermonuclease family protein [Listeria monocytogenes]EHC5259611.1 thermonuclease family protein [Listeria monocytogenes serotype 1/2a]EJQ9800472.1 thermonuclease family protein [Listeria monocytogenes]
MWKMKKWVITLIVTAIMGGGYGALHIDDLSAKFQHVTSSAKALIPGGSSTGEKAPENAIPVELDHVVDGDTISVKFEGETKAKTVRLLLIDTPESVKPNTPVQPYAKEASNYMKELVTNSNLTLEYDSGGATDKYGRVLAYVYADGKNVNEEMLKEGFARVAYVYEPNTRYLSEFKQAEAAAKEKKKNIWSKDGYVTEKGFQE